MFIEPCKSNVEDFEILKVLGQGSFGKVFLVKKLSTPDKGNYYAMKVIKKSSLKIRDRLRTQMERNILAAIDHPFIVKLFYAFQTVSKLYLVLEFLRGGDLFTRLSKEVMFTENDVKFYLAELALGVDHLHGLGIIYRDLKPENILLDKEGHIKLIDFGLCKEAMYDESAQRAYSFCGTVEYMAPEVVNRLGHGPAADWWSYGVLMYEMLTGRLPFQGVNRRDTMERILREKLQMPVSISVEAQVLLRALFKRSPCNRLGYGGLGLDQLKSMRFFRDIHWTDLYSRRILPPFKPACVRIDDACYFDPEFTSRPPKDSIVWADERALGPELFPGFDYIAPPKLSCVSSYEGSFDEEDENDNVTSFCIKNIGGKSMNLIKKTNLPSNSGGHSTSSNQSAAAMRTSSSQEESLESNLTTQHIVGRQFSDDYDLDDPFIGAQWHFCTSRSNPQFMAAVKIIPLVNRGEMLLMKELQKCKNVIKLIEVYENDRNLYLVTERPHGGSLLDRVRIQHRLSESEARQIITVIANVIHFLHSRQIVHYDLRPSILHFKDVASSSTSQNLLLCDFELAKHVSNPDQISPIECDLMRKNVDTTAYSGDLWSLGVILYTILSGKAPFGPCSFRLPRGTHNNRLVIDLHRSEWSGVSLPAKNLLKWLLEVDPTNRPSVSQVLTHPWLLETTTTTTTNKIPTTLNISTNRPRGGAASSGAFVETRIIPIKKASGSVGNNSVNRPAGNNNTTTTTTHHVSSTLSPVKRPSLPHIAISSAASAVTNAALSPVSSGSSPASSNRSGNTNKSTSRSSFTSAVTVVLNRRPESAEITIASNHNPVNLSNRTAV